MHETLYTISSLRDCTIEPDEAYGHAPTFAALPWFFACGRTATGPACAFNVLVKALKLLFDPTPIVRTLGVCLVRAEGLVRP